MPPGGPFGGGQPPEPKGNLRPLLDLVGLDWPTTEIVWNVVQSASQARRLAVDARDRLYRQGEQRGADAFNADQSASAACKKS